ncbi:MAG TPA: cob(I)yrinic acid a,c-diamide adenosyltransferase [Actinomycetota bacterium]|nr:cob(I)yrinic acid a,c-diamide adenosyltransferase [Actinomycetota bacterium]
MPDKVYTRRGDDGTTQLFFAGSERIPKNDLRPCAYGESDEAVSALGLARAHAGLEGQEDVAEIVLGLQRELFVLNAELATAPDNWPRLTPGVSLVTQQMVDRLEEVIDGLTQRFEQPKDFIVPGNTILGACLDHAARVVRRAERAAVALAAAEQVRPEALRYLNRLADLVWVLARYSERSGPQPKPRPS